MQRYYVYKHVDRATGQVRYIGKGIGKRAAMRVSRRPDHRVWMDSQPDDSFIEMLVEGLDEFSALAYEAWFLAEHPDRSTLFNRDFPCGTATATTLLACYGSMEAFVRVDAARRRDRRGSCLTHVLPAPPCPVTAPSNTDEEVAERRRLRLMVDRLWCPAGEILFERWELRHTVWVTLLNAAATDADDDVREEHIAVCARLLDLFWAHIGDTELSGDVRVDGIAVITSAAARCLRREPLVGVDAACRRLCARFEDQWQQPRFGDEWDVVIQGWRDNLIDAIIEERREASVAADVKKSHVYHTNSLPTV